VTLVAHRYRLPVSAVYGWPHSDLVAAVASIVAERDRCPGCGLTDDETWWVKAELERCPACEDRDHRAREILDSKRSEGLHVTFTPLESVDESELESSAARFTLEGAKRRARRRGRDVP